MKKQNAIIPVQPNKSEQGNPPKRCSTLPPAQATKSNPRIPKGIISRKLTELQRMVLSDIAWSYLYLKDAHSDWIYRAPYLILKNLKRRFPVWFTTHTTSQSTIRCILNQLCTLQVVVRCSDSERMRFGSQSKWTYGYKINLLFDDNKTLIEYMESCKSIASPQLASSQPVASPQLASSQPVAHRVELSSSSSSTQEQSKVTNKPDMDNVLQAVTAADIFTQEYTRVLKVRLPQSIIRTALLKFNGCEVDSMIPNIRGAFKNSWFLGFLKHGDEAAIDHLMKYPTKYITAEGAPVEVVHQYPEWLTGLISQKFIDEHWKNLDRIHITLAAPNYKTDLERFTALKNKGALIPGATFNGGLR